MKLIDHAGTEPRSRHDKNKKKSDNQCDIEMIERDTSSPLDIFVPNMKQTSQTGTVPWKGRDKNLERTLWPWHLTFWPEIVRAPNI